MSDRMSKVDELLHRELGRIISEEVELPKGVLLTIVKVDVSKDLRHAKIFVSVLPDQAADEALKKVISNAPRLKKILANTVRLRRIPQIFFLLDNSEIQAAEIDRLLDSLK